MPFTPPQSNPLLGLLLDRELRRRSQEESRAYSEQKQREAKREQEQSQLFELAQNPDLKLDAFAPLFKEIGPEDFRAGQEIQKQFKKQRADTLARGAALESAPGFGALSAPTQDARGQVVPPRPDPQLESARASAIQALPPELQAVFTQREVLARAEAERAVRDRSSGQQYALQTATAEKGEQREYSRRQELLDSTTNGIAEEVASGSYRGAGVWTEELAASAGIPKHAAARLVSEAQFRARGLSSTIARTEKGAQGKRADVEMVDAEVNSILRDYPGADPALIREGVVRQLNNTAIRDPLSEKVLGRPLFIANVGGKTEAAKLFERRRALVEVDEQYDVLKDSFDALRESVKSGRVSAGALRTSTYFDALNLVGAQPAEVAAYRNASFLYAASILKATQGSRPSDFDFKNYLALVPQLTEIQSGSADAKLDHLKNLIRIQALSEVDPSARKTANLLRSSDSAADRRMRARLNSLAAQMDKAVESGDQGEKDRVTEEFYKATQEWRSDPGATVPTPIDSAPLSKGAQSILDEF